MIKVKIEHLKSAASDRPAGYLEEVMGSGIVENDVLILDESVYYTLKKKYAKPSDIPKKGWPFWAKALNAIAKPEDKGIGDVVARLIGDENSEQFKSWYKATFNKDCGCKGRHDRWNRLYPLK